MKKKLPKVAIVGRPNVGKSALFNRVIGKRLAIVDEAEGVTRDRLYAEADCFGRPFEVIDTGGIAAKSQALFNEEVKQQAEIAIMEADSLIFVVDGTIGVTELDAELARTLLKTKKPVLLAVNKIDSTHQEKLIHEFHGLGVTEMVGVSASHGLNIAEMMEKALEPVPHIDGENGDEGYKIAIVGRPNVGKSSLINNFLDEKRCIVSPIPGTTRDSIDISFMFGEEKFTLIDTAGLRKKQAEKEVVDKFAAIRTENAIERADICLLMIDAQDGFTAYEKRIFNLIEEAKKPCVFLINKWDLVKEVRQEHYLFGIKEEASFLNHCPKLFISAKTSRNVDTIFPKVLEVLNGANERISTSQLNGFLEKAMHKNHPAMIRGKRLRIYYMTQISTTPPSFVLFINYPDLMQHTYKKYLYNQFRKVWPMTGYPIEFHLKGKPKTARPPPHKHTGPGPL